MVDSFQCLRRTVTADGKLKEDRCKESHQESKCCVYPALSCMEEQESIKYTKIRIFNTNVRLVLLNASETWRMDRRSTSQLQMLVAQHNIKIKNVGRNRTADD